MLRRQVSKRPQLSNADRFLFVWLYRWFQATSPGEAGYPDIAGDSLGWIIKNSLVARPAPTRMTKLVLTFLDSKTALQFSGWLYLEGYPDRVLEQNTVTVELPYDERDNIIEEAESRNGRVERE